MLESYYKDILKKRVEIDSIDINAITRKCDHDEIINLLELVVGCAVLCEDKAIFIQNIFSLDHLSQSILQGMVQRAMDRTYDLTTNSNMSPADNSNFGESKAAGGEEEGETEDLIRSREMVRHLQEERQRLLGSVASLEQSNIALTQDLDKLREQLSASTNERGTESETDSSDRSRGAGAARVHTELQIELDETKREIDIKSVEIEGLRADLAASNQRYEATKSLQAKLEMEVQQMADELDIARGKAIELSKVEAKLEKYQRRLEEMTEMKKQNKELELKMEEYLGKIHELETSNKIFVKQVEQYKKEYVENKTEKAEAVSNLESEKHKNELLSADLKKLKDTKRTVEDELSRLRTELEIRAEDDGDTRGSSGLGSIDSAATLMEKVKRLEIELKMTKEGQSKGGGAADSMTQESQIVVALMESQLEDIKKEKREREDALMAAKKQIVEMQVELHRCQSTLVELQQSSSVDAADVANAKQLEQLLEKKSNTMRQLEDILKEKETTINKLEQDKAKLENYARQTLSTFKDKYMGALQKMKEDKKFLEENLSILQAKYDKDQETHRREEKLILSSMYEIGLSIMDRNIHSQMQASSSNPTTFLATQRADQDRKLGNSNAARTPQGK